MKKLMKKGLSLVLAAILALSLIPAAAAADSTFTDITDPDTARNVEVLRMMGVIDGMTATTFVPDGTLTRAQFCKMAVEVLGLSQQAERYRSYTIFPDVKGSHWAAGYINLAVRGEKKFISGYSNGTFGPNDQITYGQAVTILMRLLGYTDEDVGVVWPEGYISAALDNGLTEGVSLSGSAAITRAQAARLFVNLLNARTKDGGDFASTIGTPVRDVILLDANARDDTGAAAILTSEQTYAVARNAGSAVLAGRKGTVLLDTAGKAITFIPTNVGTSRDIVIASAEADEISDTAGGKYKVYSDTLTYFNQEKGTYGDTRVFFRPGAQATIYTGATGKVEFVVVGSGTSDEAVVVSADGSTAGFQLLTERTDYKIYKNGEEVTASALRKYDVATYSSANNTVHVSDNRLTVYYKNAYPNTKSPSTITVTGIKEPLPVMHCAVESLSRYGIGQTITLLLTQDGRVAGASTDTQARGNAVGHVEGGVVKLFNGLTFDTDLPSDIAEDEGLLVTVSSSGKTTVSLSRISGSGVSGDLDVAGRKVGSAELAGNVRIYEKVGSGPLTAISLGDLGTEKVSASKISYARRNYAGKIDVLVLNDVTGDRYIYGRMTVEERTEGSGEWSYTNRYATVHYGNGESKGAYLCAAFRSGDWGGIAPPVTGDRAAGYVNLTAVKNVPVSAWRSETLVYYGGVTYTVSENVVCYNKTAGVWFDSLGAALAFGEKMTLYIDANQVVRGVEVG